ncbi:MAG: hypothetical protein IKE43_09715 [Coriobacteriales bacterium]|nr:hypothetical protein [Coriobacteriales bacterium]
MLVLSKRIMMLIAILLSFVLVLSELPLGSVRTLAAALDDNTTTSEREKEVADLNITGLNDADLLRYMEDSIYDELVAELDSDEYFVENIDTVYLSKEYLDELAYNSQANIYFGYTLAELEEAFQGTKYVFTLGEDGTTTVIPFEGYDDTYDQIIRNVAIGTGVILICITISVVTAGAGASVISAIFAVSAKTGTIAALSSGAISGIAAGICTGIQTQDFDSAIKAAGLAASEGFMWGAIIGAATGAFTEASAYKVIYDGLKGAKLRGLTLKEAALIQRESKYPLDVIKQFTSMEEYRVYKNAGLTPKIINGKTALIREIDPNIVDEYGRTNLWRMEHKMPALDSSGKPYELHHIGQQTDSTLAILTQEEHRLGESYRILHPLKESEVDHGNAWIKQREEFWKTISTFYV